MVTTRNVFVGSNLAHAWGDVRLSEDGGTPEQLLWTVIPHALSELGGARGMVDVDLLDWAGEASAAEMLALPDERHGVFIHLPRVLAACLEAFAAVAPDRQRPFAEALDGLARAAGVGKAS